MCTPTDLARGWMLKGDRDRSTAQLCVSGTLNDTACFHAQQAVEKYLKAIVALSTLPIPRTHDLLLVYQHCLAVAPSLSLDMTQLATLTPYAVQLRYDNTFWPDDATAQAALSIIDDVRAGVLAVLPTSAHP